jgi:hypothetical protein
MKYFLKFFLVTASLAAIFSACDKAADLPSYQLGTTPVLSSSVNSIAAIPADSNKTVVTFSWTFPKYATDSSSCKYVIEIDSSGRNFSKEVVKTVVGPLSATYSAKEINGILLGFGFNYNVAYDVDVRVTSSYGNNNEQYKSNVLKLKMTPYVIPPKVVPPSSGRLFLVGDATQGGWNNPVPVPTQEFAKLDSVTYAGVFNINGGNQYLMLPVNGDWSHKFAVANNSIAGLNAGGDFGYDFAQNFPAPATSGWYKIVVDFQRGKFTVTPYTGTLPTNLFIVGDATPGGWNNPVPVPSQQFTRINSSVWEIASLTINTGAQYLFLPVNGDWSHKYAVANNTVAGLAAGGEFGYDFGQNFPGPTVAGNYKFSVNFAAPTVTVGTSGKFTTTKL